MGLLSRSVTSESLVAVRGQPRGVYQNKQQDFGGSGLGRSTVALLVRLEVFGSQAAAVFGRPNSLQMGAAHA